MQSDPASAHDEMVDAIAKIISGAPFPSERSRNKARAALAVARPAVREECAKVADSFHRTKEVTRDLTGDGHITYTTTVRSLADPRKIAAAIRALE